MTMRNGKTRRDHESGAWNHRFENREQRIAWEHGSLDKFPKQACNGKKNRIKKGD